MSVDGRPALGVTGMGLDSLGGLNSEMIAGSTSQLQLLLPTSLLQDLRAATESVRSLEREVSSKKDAVQRAKDAHAQAEERLADAKSASKKLEEEMLEIILTGKAKESRLANLKAPESA